jgi:hypothetical protein
MTEQPRSTRVVISDFDMPFWSLVGFMIKVAIASIPAAIIVSIISFIIVFVGSVVLAACGVAVGGLGQ